MVTRVWAPIPFRPGYRVIMDVVARGVLFQKSLPSGSIRVAIDEH